jgi:DNA repair exonuclease SbcCD ATPase subunit
MKMTIKSVNVKDFRGAKEATFTFNEATTVITGENGAGKTTIVDAVYFALYGKNHERKKGNDFKYEPTDKFGNILEGYNMEVECTIDVDGQTHTFYRNIQKGSTKSLKINGDVISKVTDFNKVVEELLGSEEDFYTLTSTVFLLGTDNKTARKIIKSVLPKLDEDQLKTDFIETNAEIINTATPELLKGNTAEQLIENAAENIKNKKAAKERVSGKIELLQEQKEGISNDADVTNFDDIRAERDSIQMQINSATENNSKVTEMRNLKTKKEADKIVLDGKINQLTAQQAKESGTTEEVNPDYNVAVNAKNEIQKKLNMAINEKSAMSTSIATLNSTKANKEAEKAAKLEEYHTANAPIEGNCKSCGQTLPEEKQVTLKSEQASKVAAIIAEGSKIKEVVEQIDLQIADITATINAKEEIIVATQAALDKQDEIVKATPQTITVNTINNTEALTLQINELTAEMGKLDAEIAAIEIPAMVNVVDLNMKLESLTKVLANEDLIASQEGELTKYNNELQVIDEEIKKEEHIRSDIKRYQSYYADRSVEDINKNLGVYKIELFKEGKNGNLQEVFTITMDGTEYTALSAGEKIGAGLAITEALQKVKNVNLPIYIDGVESYTAEIKSERQVIGTRCIAGQKEIKGECYG